MLKMNYQNEYTQYDIEFTKNSDNVVTLKGSFPVKTDGFYLNREGHADMWDYTEYKTIYKQTEDAVMFSNNGEVEPITPENEDEVFLEEETAEEEPTEPGEE